MDCYLGTGLIEQNTREIWGVYIIGTGVHAENRDRDLVVKVDTVGL